MLTPNTPFLVADGADRISRDNFIRVAHDTFAPAVLAERDPGQYYDAILAQKSVRRGMHCDPLFILSMFQHESSSGHAGAATTTFSWGNTRPPSFGATQIGVLTQDSGGMLSKYANWLDGCIATAARLVDDGYAYADRTAIQDIFIWPASPNLVWAPAGDSNDPNGYLRSVVDYMNAHADVTVVLAGPIPRPPILTDIRTKVGFFDGYDTPRLVEAIVCHISDGSEAGDLAQLTTVVSSNYYINRAGLIRELVDPAHSAWTNGPIKAPDLTNPLIANWVRLGVNPNTRTISIEHEGHPVDDLTPAQLASSSWLIAYLCQDFHLARDRGHILGHYQIDSITRSYCPSFKDSEWNTLINSYQAGPVQIPDRLVMPPLSPDKFQDKYWPIAFIDFYNAHGGTEIFGLVRSGVFREDDKLVAYTERWRFEYAPAVASNVQGGLVGSEVIDVRYKGVAPA